MALLVVRGAVLGLFATLALEGVATAEPSAVELLTLDRAVEVALSHNPALHASALVVERDGETVAAARTRYFPSISIEASAGQLLAPVELSFRKGAFGTIPNAGPVPEKDTTVRSGQDLTLSVNSRLDQPLTQLYTAREGVRLAETARAADRAQLSGDRAAVAADVKRLYYAIFASQSALASAVEQLGARRELARTAARLVFEEAALRSDALEADSGVASAELQVRSLENRLATAKEQMNRLLGRDLRTAFEVAPPRASMPGDVDLEAARAVALQRRPELRQAQLLVEKAETDRRLKIWEYMPQVSAGISYVSTFNVDNLPKHIAMAGLFVKWEGWDWGRRKSEVAEKTLAIDEARAKARDAEAAVLVEVGDRFRKLQEAHAQVEVARRSHEALRAKAPVMLNRLRVQSALLKDALGVQAALAQAATDYHQALASLWSAQAEFEKALGTAP